MLNIYNSKVETYLSSADLDRFIGLCREKRTSRSATAREVIRWYLDHREKLQTDKKETVLAQTMQCMTNRICGMLARQGVQVGTLFEVAWQNCADTGQENRFVAAANTVKQKMRTRLTEDEKALAEKIRHVVAGQ